MLRAIIASSRTGTQEAAETDPAVLSLLLYFCIPSLPSPSGSGGNFNRVIVPKRQRMGIPEQNEEVVFMPYIAC
jgi:hypothetical protein